MTPVDPGVDRAVLRALVRLASLVTQSHDAMTTIEAVAETARDLLGAASLSISVRDDDGLALTTVVNVGDLGPDEVRWPSGERYHLATYPRAVEVQHLGRHHVALTHVDGPDADPAEVALLRRLGKAGGLNAPIVVEGQLWGELWASRRADQPPFDTFTSELSEVVVGLVAAGVVQAAAWERLQQLASTDPMTRLANRRAFDEQLDALVVGPVSAPGFALVLGDVNGLKRVNDRHGHPAGDEALLARRRGRTQRGGRDSGRSCRPARWRRVRAAPAGDGRGERTRGGPGLVPVLRGRSLRDEPVGRGAGRHRGHAPRRRRLPRRRPGAVRRQAGGFEPTRPRPVLTPTAPARAPGATSPLSSAITTIWARSRSPSSVSTLDTCDFPVADPGTAPCRSPRC